MPLLFQARIHRADLKANPRALYVFGDNEQRWGLGGQAAEMRGEPNAVGVATLRSPGEYEDAEHEPEDALEDAHAEPHHEDEALDADRVVIFPLDGIGTGLADLARRSPITFAHLESQVARLKKIGGL